MAENTVEAKGGRRVSKKALSKSFRNWYYGNLTCFSQEHMQTFGYLVSMLPIVEDLYDKKEDQAKALQTYSAFFNTEPQIGTMIVGVTVGLEEARANGEQVLVVRMNKNKKFQKEQLSKEGYEEFVEFFK